MKLLDLTLPTPEQNLACDEALLDWCEEGAGEPMLRFWESPRPFVVLGYSNKTATEANVDRARADALPILRRCTGGGAVVQGPGCLNFSLVLEIPESGPLAAISETNRHIIGRHREALLPLLGDRLLVQGTSDLALGELKFSGNAQRRKRNFLLFHGTFLVDFDVALVERALPMPSRQPDYRRNRPHHEFLTNAGVATRDIKRRLAEAWGATEPLTKLPVRTIETLARQRYASGAWNFKF
jgi:lipoate---protein ligase